MDKKRRLNTIIIILIIVLILIGVLLVYLFKNPPREKILYTSSSGDQFTFTKIKQGSIFVYYLTTFVTQQGTEKQYNLPFRYLPEETKDIPSLTSNLKTKFFSEYINGIYITMDPDAKQDLVIAGLEITNVLGKADYSVYKIPIEAALTNQSAAGYPVKTCNDATNDIKVIFLNQGPRNGIEYRNNCMIIQGITGDDVIKGSERFLYTLLGLL